MRVRVALGAILPVLVVACASEDDTRIGDSDSELYGGACLPALECGPPAAPAVPERSWRHGISSRLVTHAGSPNHRGRDLFVTPGARQTIIAKFAYGMVDKDLEDEEVDIFVQRDCSSGWEKLGTAITTDGDADHVVEGVPNAGGRIYFDVPVHKQLGLGRHRVRLVVAGDGSSTDLFIEVVPAKTPVFISDVDGTLTSSEMVEYTALLTGSVPETHAGAPEALRALAARGYHPIYVTARPEWLVQRTRDFLDKHGFPPGIVHTSTSLTGAGYGASAARFKADEMAMLAAKGLVPSYGFGNKTSDAEAYATIPVESHRILYRADGEFSGRRIESYTELLPELSGLAPTCSP